MRSTRTTLGVGLAMLAVALTAALSQTALRRTGTNDVVARGYFAVASAGQTACQAGERIPAGTGVVSVSLRRVSGSAPRVRVTVSDAAGVVARGDGTGTWRHDAVRVPIRPALVHATSGRVCAMLFVRGGGAAPVELLGEPAPPAEATTLGGKPQPGRLRFEYLRPQPQSWWAFAGTLADRLGYGHAWSGRSVALLAGILTLASVAIAAACLLAPVASTSIDPRRRGRRRVRLPRAAWACALVAVFNSAAWSLVTPAFQVPDEQSHYAYTEYLAQHGSPPAPGGQDRFSTSEALALADLRFRQTAFIPEDGTIWSPAEQQRLTRDLGRPASRSDGNGSAFGVGSEPPLYYALQAIPYALGSGGTVLARLALMRLLSALLAGVTVLFAFLFLREALPGSAWVWRVGALGLAFQPLFGFVDGGVNSDALLYAEASVLLFLIARAFRHGASDRVALAIGMAIGAGLLTKPNFAGLVPGALLGLLLASVRRDRVLRARALRAPALALGTGLAAPLLLAALDAGVWRRPAVGASAGAFWLGGIRPSLGQAASYVWQLYAVPLPGIRSLSAFPLKDVWVRGFVGSFGWVDTFFRPWVYDVALVPLAALVGLCGWALQRGRSAARLRRDELLAYGITAVGFMLFVGLACYVVFAHYGGSVAQARYLMPLAPLYAGALALACRALGRRWMPVLGCAIVVLAIAHDVFSQLLVISRYYA